MEGARYSIDAQVDILPTFAERHSGDVLDEPLLMDPHLREQFHRDIRAISVSNALDLPAGSFRRRWP